MATDDQDKLGSEPADEGAGGEGAPVPDARKSRTRWSQRPPSERPPVQEVEEPIPQIPPAADQDGQTIEVTPLIGPEPPVFGGVDPRATHADLAQPEATGEGQEPAEGGVEQIADALSADEGLKADDLLGQAPRINFGRVFRSTPFLLIMMIVSLVLGTMLVQSLVQTITYVHMVVRFANYEKLDELGREDLQLEINKLLRSYPLRAEAWKLLQARQTDKKLAPGFLNDSLIFHRLDALIWGNDGTLQLRVDCEDPATDLLRLNAVAEAFYKMAQDRNIGLEANRKKLKSDEGQQVELLRKDAALKGQAEELFSDAQRYVDVKAALGGTQRYLDLADEGNPLRLVARENLRRLTEQVTRTRQASEKRDEVLNQRVELQRQEREVQTEIDSLRRAIDSFSYPERPDSRSITVHDTRPHRQAILQWVWIGIIGAYLGLYALIHFVETHSAELKRRERRLQRKQEFGQQS